MPRSGLRLKVNLVVCSFDLGTPLNLRGLRRWLSGKYDPNTFPGMVVRIDERRVVLMYRSGKCVVTGCGSVALARRTVGWLVRRLRGLGAGVARRPALAINNMSATGALGRPVDLERMAERVPGTKYIPGLFPSLSWRIPGTKHLTVLFSRRGKVVVVGAKSWRDIADAAWAIVDLVRRHRI